VSAVDRWEGRRRINPRTGRFEVNTGGPTHNCFRAACPQPKDNWIPDPDMPWEEKGLDGEWEYPNLRKMAYPEEEIEMDPLPYNPATDQSEMVPLPYNPDTDQSEIFPLDFLNGYRENMLAGSYGQPPDMKDYIFESIQRQYGNPKFGKYTPEDQKNVINWHRRFGV